jgi:hypothetical protein
MTKIERTRGLPQRSDQLGVAWACNIGIVLLVALPANAAHAEAFDENLRAPPIAQASELKTMAARISGRVAADDVPSPSEGTSLHGDWVALEHQLTAAIDHRVPLMALADVGLAAQPDGSYKIDYQQHPQWWSLDARMETFVTTETLDLIAKPLRQRGFRTRDIEALRAYVERSSWEDTSLSRTKALAESFGKRFVARAGMQRTSKPTVSRWEVESFLYQKKRIENDARRAWVMSAFKVLDRQRQRILVSFLMDQQATAHIRPEDPDAVATRWERRLSSDEFISSVEAEMRKVAP